MNKQDIFLKEKALAIWKKSDQTTNFIFTSNQTNNRYEPVKHQIVISAKECLKNFNELFLGEGELSFSIQVTVAHELGHSIDLSTLEPEYFDALSKKLKNLIYNYDLENYTKSVDELVSIQIKSEIRAWRNARHFLEDGYDKELFYFYMRKCLTSYFLHRQKRKETMMLKFDYFNR